MKKVTRRDAIRILDMATDKDDPHWEWCVEDYYDEDTDEWPSIYHVYAALGITEDEYRAAFDGGDKWNIDWPANSVKQGDLSEVAKLLASQGTAGHSLARKVAELISVRDALLSECAAHKQEARLLQEIVADAEDWASKELHDRNAPRWLVDAQKYLGRE